MKNPKNSKFPPDIWSEILNENLQDVAEGEIELSEVKFNQLIIDESTTVLNKFKNAISKIDGKNDPIYIHNEVKSLVLSLNGLSKKHNDFISTGEREDLCFWIDDQIMKSGYSLKEYEDLTIEYREW